MPELIFSLEVEDWLRHFVFFILLTKEVRLIVSDVKTYKDLQVMFGTDFEMPPIEAMKGDVIEYRCPYITKCPTKANCFAAAAPEPLQEGDILNVKCRLCGNQKIPIYAHYAAKLTQRK